MFTDIKNYYVYLIIVPNVENFIIMEYNFKSLNLEETKKKE